MEMLYRATTFLFCLSCCSLTVFAQQPDSAPEAGQLRTRPAPSQDGVDHRLVLDVAVTDKSGKPVKGLEEKDFTVFDDEHPQKILSFQAVGSGDIAPNIHSIEPPVKVILLVDEVNTGFSRVAYERDQIRQFLMQNKGHLTHPTLLLFFSDTGTQIQGSPTLDGNVLLALFDKHATALHSIVRSQGDYGELNRFQLSANTLRSLVTKEAREPGRKIVVWISPGWPILSAPQVELRPQDQLALFSSVVGFSTALRQARVTLYSIDPVGVDAGGLDAKFYEQFLAPVTVPKKTQIGNLALQVIATQSGGLTLRNNNDMTNQINRCIADTDTYYTVAVDTTPSDQPNVYHAVSVKVGAPGLTIRTRTGYYAQPSGK
jgi:VWFA-related protein